jgi:hypothetical protein
LVRQRIGDSRPVGSVYGLVIQHNWVRSGRAAGRTGGSLRR